MDFFRSELNTVLQKNFFFVFYEVKNENNFLFTNISYNVTLEPIVARREDSVASIILIVFVYHIIRVIYATTNLDIIALITRFTVN